MPTPLGLKLYNLAQRREADGSATRPARPAGGLVWLHAPGQDAASPMLALARRLIDEDGVAVLLTCPAGLSPRPGVIHQPPPPDTVAEARAFLDHWQPDIGGFAEGELRPALLHEAAVRGIPLFLLDGRAPRLLRERDAWYPGLMRSSLMQFAHVGAVDEAAARAFRKAGAALSTVAVTGRMEEESAALPCPEAERAALARLLAARPVWFAAGVPPEEEAAVVHAHRSALQHAHRLLLILMPETGGGAEALAARLEAEEGWLVAQRQHDAEPGRAVEVYIVDSPAEYGLWYRLAPVTFLGGSLFGKGPTRTPMEAAALGSALLHGPKLGPCAPVFARLAAARATRAVASAIDLADALGDLLAPDRAARLAEAAWAVASDGAEATDRVLDRLRKTMEAG